MKRTKAMRSDLATLTKSVQFPVLSQLDQSGGNVARYFERKRDIHSVQLAPADQSYDGRRRVKSLQHKEGPPPVDDGPCREQTRRDEQ